MNKQVSYAYQHLSRTETKKNGAYNKKHREVQKGSEVEEEKPAENSADENAALLAKLLSNPDTAALLKALAKTI